MATTQIMYIAVIWAQLGTNLCGIQIFNHFPILFLKLCITIVNNINTIAQHWYIHTYVCVSTYMFIHMHVHTYVHVCVCIVYV